METPKLDFAELQALAQTLVTGFEALLAEMSTQRQIETMLRKRLVYAADEYSKLSEDPNIVDDPVGIVQDLQYHAQTEDMPLWFESVDSISFKPEIESARQASRTLRKKIAQKPEVRFPPLSRKCPVTGHTTDLENFEHDFTTPGKTGNLECPFAKKLNTGHDGLPDTPTSTLDPIAAEFHQDRVSVTGSAPPGAKCPIRFLDQHSPEEVAQYFENHKHEIPRSHEICVKRYQQNEQSIRQLDAKYGNLVSMIQGLGVKHKQYLPEKDEKGDHDDSSPRELRLVEEWAEHISDQADPVTSSNPRDGRASHFERPLREIRVGESPSRPWGISVPADKGIAESASGSEINGEGGGQIEPSSRSSDGDVSQQQPARVTSNAVPKSCPFGHGATGGKKADVIQPSHSPPAPPAKESPSTDAKLPPTNGTGSANSPPTIVFNGPVFFGYSPDQAAAFLESLRLDLGRRV